MMLDPRKLKISKFDIILKVDLDQLIETMFHADEMLPNLLATKIIFFRADPHMCNQSII